MTRFRLRGIRGTDPVRAAAGGRSPDRVGPKCLALAALLFPPFAGLAPTPGGQRIVPGEDRGAHDEAPPVARAAPSDDATPPWGADGHRMAARAAVGVLPPEMPAFFRDAGERLVYLNPEPDRWRERQHREMDQAFQYDHYIDLENAPASALAAPDRYAFLRQLYAAGIERPEQAVGFLPFRIVEIYQRLVTEWRLWRAEEDPARRGWIAERIVNDAGILGHYVTDASQPHHTTIHFNGWDRDTPNPEGYTTDRGFHARFESAFVGVHVSDDEVSRRMSDEPLRPVGRFVRAVVLEHIMDSFRQVETLYLLDRDVGFDPFEPPHPRAVGFAASRLASGAEMLATLWWSAWVESGEMPESGRRP